MNAREIRKLREELKVEQEIENSKEIPMYIEVDGERVFVETLDELYPFAHI